MTRFLRSLNAAYHGKTTSIRVSVGGDSVLWGSASTGMTAITNNVPNLTQTRNNITSPSCMNLFRRWLAAVAIDGRNQSEPEGGSTIHWRDYVVSPLGDDIALRGSFTGAKAPKATQKTTDSVSGAILTIAPMGSAELSIHSKMFTVLTRAQSVDPQGRYLVMIDGVGRGTYHSTYGAIGEKSEVTYAPTLAPHRIQIRNYSKTAPLYLDGVRVRRQVQFDNRAISGSDSTIWLPTGSVLAAAVPSDTTHFIFAPGINNRSRGRNSAELEYEVNKTLDWLAANRPDMAILLASMNASRGVKETFGNPTVYAFPLSEVAAVMSRIAAARGLDYIDFTALTHMMDVFSESFTTDDQHPNDAGHKAIAEHLIRAVMGAGNA